MSSSLQGVTVRPCTAAAALATARRRGFAAPGASPAASAFALSPLGGARPDRVLAGALRGFVVDAALVLDTALAAASWRERGGE